MTECRIRIPWPGILRHIARECGDDASHVLAVAYGGMEVYIPRSPRPHNDPLDVLALLPVTAEQWIREHYGGTSWYINKASYARACYLFQTGNNAKDVAHLLGCTSRTARRYHRAARLDALI